MLGGDGAGDWVDTTEMFAEGVEEGAGAGLTRGEDEEQAESVAD